jgi:hypothetical protein
MENNTNNESPPLKYNPKIGNACTALKSLFPHLTKEEKLDLLSMLKERQARKKATVKVKSWLDVYRKAVYPPGKRPHKTFVLPGESIARHSCVEQ